MSSGHSEEAKLTEKIKIEAQNVLKYLERYVFLMKNKNDAGVQNELKKLGADFPGKIKSVMEKLRKDLIGSKMFLNKLENAHGGLS